MSCNLCSMQKYMGKVCFDSNPNGALIYIDGKILTHPDGSPARTPTCSDIIEGRRDIVYRLQGYPDHADYVDVFAGATVNKYADLESGRGATKTPLGAISGVGEEIGSMAIADYWTGWKGNDSMVPFNRKLLPEYLQDMNYNDFRDYFGRTKSRR